MKFAVLPCAYGKLTCDPVSPTLSNQPAKVYPALVVVTEAANCKPVLVVVAVTDVPELVSKLTVRVFAVHLAKSVKFAVLPWVYGKVTAEPVNSEFSYQPANV